MTGECGGQEASNRISLKGLRLAEDWGELETSDRTSFKGLRLAEECGGWETLDGEGDRTKMGITSKD